MKQFGWKASQRTIVIGIARFIAFAIGIALILALLLCFALESLGFEHDAIGTVFPWIIVLLVYDAGALVLLRVAFAFSVRRDRPS